MSREVVTSPESRTQTIDHLIAQYLDSEAFTISAPSPNSQVAYRTDLSQFRRFCQKHDITNPSQLEAEDIQVWIAEMKAQNKKENTINRKIAAFKTFCRWTPVTKLLPDGFVKQLPNAGKSEIKPLMILSMEKLEELVSLTLQKPSLRDAAVVQVAIKTGAKITEIVNLKVGDLLIYQRSGLVGISFDQDSEKPQKSRVILLDKEATEILKQFIAEKGPESTTEQYLFVSLRNKKHGKRLTRAGMWQIVKAYGQAIGVPDISLQTLRNTFVANLKVKPEEFAQILGLSPKRANVIKDLLESERLQVLRPKLNYISSQRVHSSS